MPTAPEFGNVATEVWHVEVAHQSDAEQFGTSDGDIAVAREVAVNLDGKERRRNNQVDTALAGDIAPNLVHIDRAVVGHHYLLEESPQHLADAVDSHSIVELPLPMELWQQVGGALDRTGYQLREEADVGKERHYVACGL